MVVAQTVVNPYWDNYKRFYPNGYYKWDEIYPGNFNSAYSYRHDVAIPTYGFAVPDDKALDTIASLKQPIIEIGAGLGYWASLLNQLGVDIVATDILGEDYRQWFKQSSQWYQIKKMTALKAIKLYPKRTLMMIWPYMDDMALKALNVYRGQYLIYVGEDMGGCCATDEFFQKLEQEFTGINSVDIPQWEGLHDYLTIWRRNEYR